MSTEEYKIYIDSNIYDFKREIINLETKATVYGAAINTIEKHKDPKVKGLTLSDIIDTIIEVFRMKVEMISTEITKMYENEKREMDNTGLSSKPSESFKKRALEKGRMMFDEFKIKVGPTMEILEKFL
jgi:hypothetical protein